MNSNELEKDLDELWWDGFNTALDLVRKVFGRIEDEIGKEIKEYKMRKPQ